MIGTDIYELCKELFPICRSLTGEGVRETLHIMQRYLPDLKLFEVPTGTQCFDWTVPREWNIRDAFIEYEDGTRIVNFQENNLHVVGYSTPVDAILSLEELESHLYSDEDQPSAIPYVTSYYSERWGFCLSYEQRLQLKKGKYRVFIDSTLENGHLTYGELIIPGQTDEEVFISSYICHPSMANNELSGPTVATFLAKWVLQSPKKYTYRFVFIPETIGSILYLSRNLKALQKNVFIGFNLSCLGDNNGYSYISSRYGNTYADRVIKTIMKQRNLDYIEYSFLKRGSDERQYVSPGIDLPLVTVCRSKFGEYSEYHSSLDDLEFISSDGLQGSYDLLVECLELVEQNACYKIKTLGEPQLGKRGLYPTISQKGSAYHVKAMMDFIAYADGSNDLLEISDIIDIPVKQLYPIVDKLYEAELLTQLKNQ